jgi:ADP-ribose pyrophosphatase YjhB (NUDIX family)
MTLRKDSYCSYCGTAMPAPSGPEREPRYPRTCPHCATTVWSNPIPVAVVLQPVVKGDRTGLLVVRRGIEPRRGLLALVGGFVEDHETVQEGGAREVREETNVKVAPERLRPFGFTSTDPRPNRVLLFLAGDPIEVGELGAFAANPETLERGLVFGPARLAEVFAFPLHLEAAKRWFAERGAEGPHDYETV